VAPSTFFCVRTSSFARDFDSRESQISLNYLLADGNLTRDSRALCALLQEIIQEVRRTN